jgi:hypothetical protein
LVRHLVPVSGYLSQGDPRVHFGLDDARRADRVEIRWPDGSAQSLEDVPVRRMLTVVQKKGGSDR